MDKKFRQIMLLITFGVVLFAALMNLGSVAVFLKYLGDLLLPVISGLIIAFVLIVPVKGIEKLFGKLFAKSKHKPGKKLLRIISIVLTLVIVAAVIFALSTVVIPQAAKTVKSIITLFEKNLPTWISFLEENGVNTELIDKITAEFDIKELANKIGTSAGVVVGSIAGAATATVTTLTNAVFGLIIALYVLADTENLARQARKILNANLKTETADKILHAARLMQETYAKFLSGQCVEAVILGVLMLVAFLIFDIPYAGLVAMLTAVCALIPYVGALVSCAVAVILALLISPEKALVCFIVYQAVQFIENQFIYPHVVGGSVGLSPLWTLVAVIIGGKLFGLVGMLMFIPLTAVIIELVGEITEKKLAQKKTAQNTNK